MMILLFFKFINFAFMKNVVKYFIYFLIGSMHFLSFSQGSDKIIDSLTFVYNNIETVGEDHFFSVLNPLLKKPKNYREKLNAIYFLGQYYNYKGISDSAIYSGEKLIKLTGSKSDTLTYKMLARAYYLLGVGNNNKGLYDRSKYWHQKGIELSEKINEKMFLSMHTHGLANTYTHLKDNEKALELFEKTIKSDISSEIVYGSHINIGNIYGEKANYKLSNTHYEKALAMCKKEGNNSCIAIALLNIGENHYELKDYNTALEYYEKASKIIGKHKLNNLNPAVSILIGALYMDLKQYDNALMVLYLGLHHAIEYNYMHKQLEFYDRLRDIAIIKRDFRTALDHERKRSSVMNSIHEMQKEKEISELEVKFSTLQKEKEIEVLKISNSNRELKLKNQDDAIQNLLLEQENDSINKANEILVLHNDSEKRENEIVLLKKDQLLNDSELSKQKSAKKIMLIAFLIILIPSIALLFMYYQKLMAQNQLNKKQKEINQQKITTIIKDQELLLIEASIEGQDAEKRRIAQELHDSIGGNLAAIKLQFGSISNGNEIYKIITNQIDETYEQVRSISHDLIPKKFSQNSFLSVIEEYMANIGDASNLSITCNAFPRGKINDIDEIIQVEIFKILQELITNTIKHAKASIVEVQLNLLDDTINVLFEDNGVGFDANKVSEGIGFTNIKTRLQKLNGVINIDSFHQRGSIINLEIPIVNIYSEV